MVLVTVFCLHVELTKQFVKFLSSIKVKWYPVHNFQWETLSIVLDPCEKHVNLCSGCCGWTSEYK